MFSEVFTIAIEFNLVRIWSKLNTSEHYIKKTE